jgi:hypothetical protein
VHSRALLDQDVERRFVALESKPEMRFIELEREQARRRLRFWSRMTDGAIAINILVGIAALGLAVL